MTQTEDLLDHRPLQESRVDLQLAAAVRAVLQIRFEDRLERRLAPSIN